MTIGKKIKIMRENRNWTQAVMADMLSISPDTVQKWEVEKNTPPTAEIKRLCQLFDISADLLLDDSIEVTSYIVMIDESLSFCPRNDEGDHEIFDAALRKEAKLHRFFNSAGQAYSAIYYSGQEVFSCERSHESLMIKYWNEIE